MTDPVFLIAVSGLGLSVVVSGFRLINWFLRSDPKLLAQAGRLSAVGLFALSLPLLLGLAVNQRWAEAIGLSAVMLLGFTLYGPRILGQLFPRRLVPDFGAPAAGNAGHALSESDTELVQRSIAVLEEYLRRTVQRVFPSRMESCAAAAHKFHTLARAATEMATMRKVAIANFTMANATPVRCRKRKPWRFSASAPARPKPTLLNRTDA